MVCGGLPQGSPVSPLPPAIYMSGVHVRLSNTIRQVRGLSFVDDVMWIAAGGSVREVEGLLGKAAEEAIKWGRRNAVEFEAEKTEATLLSRSRKHRRDKARSGVRVQGSLISFNRGATR